MKGIGCNFVRVGCRRKASDGVRGVESIRCKWLESIRIAFTTLCKVISCHFIHNLQVFVVSQGDKDSVL